jgi:uncharacterized protein (TIRG00374 family)
MTETRIPVIPEARPAVIRSRSRNLVFKIIGVVALGLFVYLIYKTGIGKIWEGIRRLTIPEMFALLGLRFIYWGVRTANWQLVLSSSGERVSFWELFGARVAGCTVGILTPAGNLGAETMRVFMLDRIDRKKVVATVALAVTFLLLTFTMPRGRSITIVALTAGFLALVVFLMAKQKRGLFTWALDKLARLRIRVPALEKRRDKIRETDAHISEFYTRRRGLFFLLFGSYTGMTWIWALELFATFLFVGGSQVGLFKCFLMVTLGSFFTFIPVPGALGVYELTYVSLFALLGIDMSVGMAVLLARRILSLAWSGVGLVPILRKRSVQGRRAEA